MILNTHINGLKNKLYIIGFVFAMSFFGIYTYTNAQTNSTSSYQNDFVLEPGKMEIFVNPGDIINRSITVTNRMPTSMRFKVETEDFMGSAEKDRAVILLGDEVGPNSFKNNLIPEKTDFTLSSGEKANIPIRIVIPQNAQPGGFYASVLVSNQPNVEAMAESDTEAQGKTRIISRVGVLFFIRVNGEVQEKGFVEDFSTSNNKSLFSKGPYSFEISFQNDGTVHLVPYGLITIKNLFGNVIGSIPVDAYFSLPKSVRFREVTWQNPSFLFGRYTANLEMHLGYGKDIDYKSVSFWVIPWNLVIIIFVGLLLFVSIAYMFFSKFELHRK